MQYGIVNTALMAALTLAFATAALAADEKSPASAQPAAKAASTDKGASAPTSATPGKTATTGKSAVADKAASPGTAAATDQGAPTAAKTKKPKGPPPENLVDLNSANKSALKRLPGVGDAEADKIIANRPYRSKADLVTRNVVSAGVYEQIRRLVVAKPK